VDISYNDNTGTFDIQLGFCLLRFYLPEYIRSCGVSDIAMVNRDVFEYTSGGLKEYESISRRILGESESYTIPYTMMDGGYRFEQYDVDVITKLSPHELVRRVCDICERNDAVWELQKASS